jgi:hypothetical protein
MLCVDLRARVRTLTDVLDEVEPGGDLVLVGFAGHRACPWPLLKPSNFSFWPDTKPNVRSHQ